MSTLASATERTQLAAPVVERQRWRQPLLWGLSGFSLPIAGFLANAVIGAVDDPGSGALAGAIAGAVLGGAQSLALGGPVRHGASWIAATAVGFSIGLALGTAAVDAGTGVADLVLSGAITGAAIGTAQFLVLRRSSRIAAAWIPVMSTAWAVGWAVTWAARVDVDKGWSNFGAAGVVVFGVLTALALFVVPGILARKNSLLPGSGS